MSTYTKPHLTLREQVALLQERGLVVKDVEAASRWLSTIGYYRLSGYWYPFREPAAGGAGRSDVFAPGSCSAALVIMVLVQGLPAAVSAGEGGPPTTDGGL